MDIRIWRAYFIAALSGGAGTDLAVRRADKACAEDEERVKVYLASGEGPVVEGKSPAHLVDKEQWQPGHPETEDMDCLLALQRDGAWELLASMAWTTQGVDGDEPAWVPTGLNDVGEKPGEGESYKLWEALHDRIEKAEHVLWRPAPPLPPGARNDS